MARTAYRIPAPPDPEPAPKPPPDEEAQLGALRSSHKPGEVWRSPMKGGLIVIVSVLPALAVAQLLTAMENSVAVLIILLVALSISGLIGWVVLSRKPTARVDVHQRGLVVYRRTAYEVVLFEEVDELWIEQRWVGHGPRVAGPLAGNPLAPHEPRERGAVSQDASLPLAYDCPRHHSAPNGAGAAPVRAGDPDGARLSGGVGGSVGGRTRRRACRCSPDLP